MYSLLFYFIKSFLSLGIFYLTWFLFLRKQTDFRFNRYYLLFSTLLAIIIPLVRLPELFPAGFQNPIGSLPATQLGEILIGSTNSGTAVHTGLSLQSVFWGIYLSGVLAMAVRFMVSLLQLYRLVRKSETHTEKGITYVFTTGGLPVFSFFHWVFIRKEMFENPHAAAIINHEKIHIRQRHSLDLLVLEILNIFQWFNPVVYLIKRAVKENHEFIADSGLTITESNENRYLNLLFSEAGGFEFSPITHNFSSSLLKKRMIMMKNQKSPRSLPVRLLLSALALSLVLFACNTQPQPAPEKPAQVAVKAENGKVILRDQTPAERAAVAAQVDTGQVFMVVEKTPEFPGGLKAFMHYLANHIQYPAEAKKARVQGRVFINFIVEKDGSISHVKVMRGIGHGCDKEAVKAVENMPRWIPGYQRGKPVRVSFNVPVKFSLQ